MGKQNENILSVVDVGTAKTVALVAEITDAGLRYRGHGIAAFARLAQGNHRRS